MSEQNEMDNNPVLDALALGVEPVAPPPDLRDRVLSAASGVGAVREGAEVVPLRRGRWRAGLRLPLGAVAAMVAIALLAGLAAGDLIGRGSAPPTPTSQAPRFFLQGHGPMSSVNGMVIDLRSEGFALVSFSGLPELPPGKVYQLWLITPGNRADPAGVFVPDAGGEKVLVLEHNLAGYKLMAVTIEAGPEGVAAPTQQPLIYGTVT